MDNQLPAGKGATALLAPVSPPRRTPKPSGLSQRITQLIHVGIYCQCLAIALLPNLSWTNATQCASPSGGRAGWSCTNAQWASKYVLFTGGRVVVAKWRSASREKGPSITCSAAIARLLSGDSNLKQVVFLANGAAVASAVPSEETEATAIIVSNVLMTRERVIDHLRCDLKLSARQAQIAYSLIQGMSRADIALALGVTIYTVRRHAEAIYSRLSVNTLCQLEGNVASLVQRNLNSSPMRSTHL
jgi:DNA-binding CsgD family transcriptional regulator